MIYRTITGLKCAVNIAGDSWLKCMFDTEEQGNWMVHIIQHVMEVDMALLHLQCMPSVPPGKWLIEVHVRIKEVGEPDEFEFVGYACDAANQPLLSHLYDNSPP